MAHLYGSLDTYLDFLDAGGGRCLGLMKSNNHHHIAHLHQVGPPLLLKIQRGHSTLFDRCLCPIELVRHRYLFLFAGRRCLFSLFALLGSHSRVVNLSLWNLWDPLISLPPTADCASVDCRHQHNSCLTDDEEGFLLPQNWREKLPQIAIPLFLAPTLATKMLYLLEIMINYDDLIVE